MTKVKKKKEIQIIEPARSTVTYVEKKDDRILKYLQKQNKFWVGLAPVFTFATLQEFLSSQFSKPFLVEVVCAAIFFFFWWRDNKQLNLLENESTKNVLKKKIKIE